MFPLKSLSTVGEILLLAVCAAVICITTSMDTTLLCYLIFTYGPLYKPHTVASFRSPIPVYTLEPQRIEFDQVSLAHEFTQAL